MSSSLYTYRKVKNAVALTLSIAAAIFGLMWLVWILWTTITKGMGSLNLDLFTQMTPPPNEADGIRGAVAAAGAALDAVAADWQRGMRRAGIGRR